MFPNALPEKIIGNPVEEAESGLVIRLRGQGYRDRDIRRPAGSVRAENPVLVVRMEPDREYPFLPGTIFLQGKLEADTRLLAAAAVPEDGLFLAEDYGVREQTISIYRGGERDLSGCLFYVTEADDGQQGDWISVERPEPSKAGSYRLCAPSDRGRNRAKTRLFPAFSAETGETPEPYFLAFPVSEAADREREYDLVCRVEKRGSAKEHRLRVRPGETLTRDF